MGRIAENHRLRGIVRQAFHPRHLHIQQSRERARRQGIGNVHVGGLAAGSRPEQHLRLGALQLGHKRIGRDQQIGGKHQSIAVEIRVLADDIKINPQPRNRSIPIQRDVVRTIAGTLRQTAACPARFVIQHQRDAGLLARANRRQQRLFARHLGHLDMALIGGAVWQQETRMELLLRERRQPQAEIGHHINTMRKGEPGPKPDHTLGWGLIMRGPVYRAGLLLHHPNAAAAHGAIKIMVEGGLIRIAHTQKTRLVGVGQAAIGQPAQWIDIPRRHINVFAQSVMVEIGVLVHEVMGDRPARRMQAQDIDLNLVEGTHLI